MARDCFSRNDWYSDLNRRVRRDVEHQQLLEREKKEYESERQWEEEWNSDLNRRVRREVDHRRTLERDERDNVIATRKIEEDDRKRDLDEQKRLFRNAKIQINIDNKNNRRKRLARKTRMDVDNEEEFFLQAKYYKKNLMTDFNDNK